MSKPALSVREMMQHDIDAIAHYWTSSDDAHLAGMGVDLQKRPTVDQLQQMLKSQLDTPLEQKRAYCIIWLVDGKPAGHCNTNPSFFGEEAYMHLHLWNGDHRRKGIGTALVKMSLPYFFNNLKLKRLYSEPYALNPAPHKALEQAGFILEKEYVTIPGTINFEQPVKRWMLTYDRFISLG